MSKRRLWMGILAVVGVIGIAGGGFVALGGRLPARNVDSHSPNPVVQEPHPIAVTVADVGTRDVQRSVQVVGSLYGLEEIALSSKVSGKIGKVHHDIGDVVKPGELLLEIEPIDHELAVSEAQRSLQLEAAKLGLTELPSASFEIEKLPSVVRTGVVLKNALAKKERSAKLATQSAVSREERDQLDADYEVARANYLQSLLDARTTLAQLQHRQAALEVAQQKLRDTKLVVPRPSLKTAAPRASASADSEVGPEEVEYVIAARMVSEGEMVLPNAATPLFRLVIDRPLKLSVNIPERHAGTIKVGQTAQIEVESLPGELIEGKVSRVNPTVDRANRTFGAEIQIPNDDRRLSAGSFARATIDTHRDPRALAVPDSALVSFAGVTKVFVVRDDQAHVVPVKIGARIQAPRPARQPSTAGEAGEAPAGWTEVTGALRAGDKVVVTGHSQLTEGTLVRIRSADDESK